mmetsp:Transcript_40807/g.49693  ORF Transcript_40807/g.49693 Transcript_40807/m.49693 type:complete len:311 (-) Transcript_40807:255-1187(-)
MMMGLHSVCDTEFAKSQATILSGKSDDSINTDDRQDSSVFDLKEIGNKPSERTNSSSCNPPRQIHVPLSRSQDSKYYFLCLLLSLSLLIVTALFIWYNQLWRKHTLKFHDGFEHFKRQEDQNWNKSSMYKLGNFCFNANSEMRWSSCNDSITLLKTKGGRTEETKDGVFIDTIGGTLDSSVVVYEQYPQDNKVVRIKNEAERDMHISAEAKSIHINEGKESKSPMTNMPLNSELDNTGINKYIPKIKNATKDEMKKTPLEMATQLLEPLIECTRDVFKCLSLEFVETTVENSNGGDFKEAFDRYHHFANW